MINSKYWLRHLLPSIALDEEGLAQFLHFGKFCTKKQGFPPYASRQVAHAFSRELQITKTLHLWIFHGNLCFPTYGQEIWVGFEPSKRSKTLKKSPYCPYFDTQEAVLGEWTFGGENGGQIEIFHFGWKVDR